MDIEKMKTWLKSDDAKEYFAKEAEEERVKKSRHKRFEKWLKKNDFDKLMYRLILEHNDDYREKCYHNGCMPYPNNKLSFVLGYITDNYASVNVNALDCMFANEVWQFRGYYFQHIWGQGVITKIFNKDDLKELLTI
jgi:hypothetical protein